MGSCFLERPFVIREGNCLRLRGGGCGSIKWGWVEPISGRGDFHGRIFDGRQPCWWAICADRCAFSLIDAGLVPWEAGDYPRVG